MKLEQLLETKKSNNHIKRIPISGNRVKVFEVKDEEGVKLLCNAPYILRTYNNLKYTSVDNYIILTKEQTYLFLPGIPVAMGDESYMSECDIFTKYPELQELVRDGELELHERLFYGRTTPKCIISVEKGTNVTNIIFPSYSDSYTWYIAAITDICYAISVYNKVPIDMSGMSVARELQNVSTEAYNYVSKLPEDTDCVKYSDKGFNFYVILES